MASRSSPEPQENPLFLGRGSRRGVPGAEEFGGEHPISFSFSLFSPQRHPRASLGCWAAFLWQRWWRQGHGDLKCKRKPSSRDSGTEELRKGPRGQEGVGERPLPCLWLFSLALASRRLAAQEEKVDRNTEFLARGLEKKALGNQECRGAGVGEAHEGDPPCCARTHTHSGSLPAGHTQKQPKDAQ